MVEAAAIFSWDQKMGAVLEVIFPEHYDLSSGLINKIYMTHAYDQSVKNQEITEITYKDNIIISYCDKTRVAEVGYEITLLILHEKEKSKIFQLKKRLAQISQELFSKSKFEWEDFFLKEIQDLFKKNRENKILLLGRAGTGKSSIKKIIFEGADPKDLIYKPLEPTRGITPSVHSWLDLKLGVFDSSGQELNYLLTDESEQSLAFENTDIIIYLFDFPVWVAQSEDIIEEIKKIQGIIRERKSKAVLKLFLHKIDLILPENREKYIQDISKKLQEIFNLDLYFTSIYPNLIYTMYNAFYEILSKFSVHNTAIKSILDEKISNLSKVMCFITNQMDSIIIQTMSKNFNTNLINHSHKLIAQLNQTFDDMVDNDDIEHIIISSKKKLNITMRKLNIQKFDIKNLICISEALSVNKLIWLMGEIRLGINDYLYKSNKNE